MVWWWARARLCTTYGTRVRECPFVGVAVVVVAVVVFGFGVVVRRCRYRRHRRRRRRVREVNTGVRIRVYKYVMFAFTWMAVWARKYCVCVCSADAHTGWPCVFCVRVDTRLLYYRRSRAHELPVVARFSFHFSGARVHAARSHRTRMN